MTAIDSVTSPNVRQVRLRWAGEGVVFRGGPDEGVEITVDSDGVQGQTPMQLLLMALGSCMAVDVQTILEKSRVPLHTLEVEAVGVRALEPPRRYLSLSLIYRLGGPGAEHQGKVERAIELSRDKYCSVLNTLDPDIELDIRVERA
jgi:putative redox protein